MKGAFRFGIEAGQVRYCMNDNDTWKDALYVSLCCNIQPLSHCECMVLATYFFCLLFVTDSTIFENECSSSTSQ